LLSKARAAKRQASRRSVLRRRSLGNPVFVLAVDGELLAERGVFVLAEHEIPIE